MNTVTRLQVSQPISSQPTMGQPEQKVSFKGNCDCYEKSSKDVAAAATVGAAAGALTAKTINDKFVQYAKHYNVDMNKDMTAIQKCESHIDINEEAVEAKQNYKADLKTAKDNVKTAKDNLKTAKIAAKVTTEAAEKATTEGAAEAKATTAEAKKAAKEVAEEAKKAAKQELKDLKKVPVKYRAAAAAAGAVVVGGTYAIAKALVNKFSKDN